MWQTPSECSNRVEGARIDEVRHGKLTDLTQPLETGRVDRAALLLAKFDEAVDRVPDAKAGHSEYADLPKLAAV